MSDEISQLSSVVRAELAQADTLTVSIVTAVAGLLGAIAYADRAHSDAERREITRQLGRIEGLGPDGPTAILAVVERHLVALSTKFVPRFARTLRETTEVATRLQILEVLLDLAAADGAITLDEVVSLRNLTQALGLSQTDYNQLQAKYRALLHFNG